MSPLPGNLGWVDGATGGAGQLGGGGINFFLSKVNCNLECADDNPGGSAEVVHFMEDLVYKPCLGAVDGEGVGIVEQEKTEGQGVGKARLEAIEALLF